MGPTMTAHDATTVTMRDRYVRRIHHQGALMGLLVGDALGAQVEFRSAAEIRRTHPQGVREMEPSAVWNTAAGQPTDDGELALTLADTLVQCEGTVQPKAIMEAYREWLRSDPFDIGTTTWRGITGRPDPQSESNGALMRVTPIAMLFCVAGRDIAGAWGSAESALTHPSPACAAASLLFTASVATALATERRGRQIAADCAEAAEELAPRAPGVCGTIQRALDHPPPSYETNMGWVGTTLGNAIHCLAQEATFEEGLVDTVNRGGDTDTNAAVCGALLGALHGVRAIPERWLTTVRQCSPTGEDDRHGAHARPQRLWPRRGLELANQLSEMTPARPQALRALNQALR